MIKKFIALVLRFFRILSPVEKNKFLLLTISNLFASFLELIFISLLVPVFYGFSSSNSKFLFVEELINSLSIYFQVENNLIFKISIILVFVFLKYNSIIQSV